MTDILNFEGMTCPAPSPNRERIVAGHGGGGKLSRELVEQIFLPAFRNEHLACLADAAVMHAPRGKMAISTDAYVVQPLFFPGGCIGDLAVHGTVNDLAMSGAKPLYMSAAFILEEGFSLEELQRIANAMGDAARRIQVPIVAADTKVVQRGHGDGCYITTCGVGEVAPQSQLAPDAALPGDAILVSGPLGNHGMAIMSVREGLQFESTIESDTAPLHDLVAQMLQACPEIRVLRDPTRGGLSASLNELALASDCGMEIEETAVPIEGHVQSACEILGLDPWQVANEGKLVCVAPAAAVSALLEVMRAHPLGNAATRIGTVVADHPRLVVARTVLGARRVVPMPLGEQLPRIC